MRKRRQFRGTRESIQLGFELITDIPVIERIAQQTEDDDFNFRFCLKFKNKLSGKELDDTVRTITDEVWQKIDCTTCANCCKTLGITVSTADITRLSKRLNMTRKEFSAAYVTKDAMGDDILKSRPCVLLAQTTDIRSMKTGLRSVANFHTFTKIASVHAA